MPTLLQPLPSGPLAIVGDVHGEIEALDALLHRLDALPGPRRTIVFVGDLIDRGPDSVAVVDRVAGLVASGRACAIVGNHELNLLAGDRKEGNGWYFGDADDGAWVEAVGREVNFGSRVADEAERARVRAFCASLPLALERHDLRVVHAAWQADAAAALPPEGDLAALDAHFDAGVRARLDAAGLHAAAVAERAQWAGLRKRPVEPPAMLAAVQAVDLAEQNDNPVKVLTSGLEEPIAEGARYYVGGKWRYVQRSRWWRVSPPDRPTVVGHYWRSRVVRPPGLADVWDGVGPFAWEGNTFCVDYSVGRRYAERARGPVGEAGFRAGLGALLWPEAALCFDDREVLVPTEAAPAGAAG